MVCTLTIGCCAGSDSAADVGEHEERGVQAGQHGVHADHRGRGGRSTGAARGTLLARALRAGRNAHTGGRKRPLFMEDPPRISEP